MENVPLPVKYRVKSLFHTVLDLVAKSVADVDSLVSFPSIVGETLFRRCIEVGLLRAISPDAECDGYRQRKIKVLGLFVEAYPDEVLISMRLSDSLILVNEHLDQLTVLMTHIKSLDLSYCGLGPSHEMIEVIGLLTLLENLTLKRNCLFNYAICKITHPLHVLGRGPAHLKHLDLSDNPSLNDNMIGWLSRFKDLKYLNLTGTRITDRGREILKKKCKLFPCENAQFKRKPIITVGWAQTILERWSDIINRRFEHRMTNTADHWGEVDENAQYMYCCSNPRSDSNFIFKRLKNMEPEGFSIELQETMEVSEKTIEEDIFSQYRN